MLIVHDGRLPGEYVSSIRNRAPQAELLPFEGIRTPLKNKDCVYGSILSHPDIYLFQLDERTIVHAPGLDDRQVAAIEKLGIDLIKGEKDPYGAYPGTAGYNAVRIGKRIFHNLKCTDKVILEKARERALKSVNVEQGYTRCSVMVLAETAMITSDKGIAAAARAEDLDVLLISPGFVSLPGEKYGFFGGVSGKSGEGVLFVLGDLDMHPAASEIKGFLAKYNIKYISAKGLPLYDAGGLFVFDR